MGLTGMEYSFPITGEAQLPLQRGGCCGEDKFVLKSFRTLKKGCYIAPDKAHFSTENY